MGKAIKKRQRVATKVVEIPRAAYIALRERHVAHQRAGRECHLRDVVAEVLTAGLQSVGPVRKAVAP